MKKEHIGVMALNIKNNFFRNNIIMEEPKSPHEQLFRKMTFIKSNRDVFKTSDSQELCKEAIEQLNRRASFERKIELHNELLTKFFTILENIQEEDKKKCKCCSIM